MAEQMPHLQDRELPDSGVVVVHGQMKFSDMRKRAQACQDAHGIWGLSGEADPELDADEIAARSHLQHSTIQECTAGALRQAGFPVEFTFRGMHVTIKLPGRPTDEILESLAEVFGPRRRKQEAT